MKIHDSIYFFNQFNLHIILKFGHKLVGGRLAALIEWNHGFVLLSFLSFK